MSIFLKITVFLNSVKYFKFLFDLLSLYCFIDYFFTDNVNSI